jgi:hypothetical protein
MTGNVMTGYLRCVAAWRVRSAQKFLSNLMPPISGCKRWGKQGSANLSEERRVYTLENVVADSFENLVAVNKLHGVRPGKMSICV